MCGRALRGIAVQAQQERAHLTNASLSSVGGPGPPKPPLTRHLASSSERAVRRGTRKCEAGGQAGGRAGRGSVLSIHDPWGYTLSCNTCNSSRHPLSRAGARGVGGGGQGGGGVTARIHSQVIDWNQPPRCHVYCLGRSMVRHCSWGRWGGRCGPASPLWAQGVPSEPPLTKRCKSSSPHSRRLQD